MNEHLIIGNLGKDASEDAGETRDNKRYLTLSVATSESWKDKTTGERKEKTQWHRVKIWGNGLCEFLMKEAKKGQKILIKGKLQTTEWEDKSGQRRWTTETVVQGPDCSVRLLGKPGPGGPPAPDEAPDSRFDADVDYDAGVNW